MGPHQRSQRHWREFVLGWRAAGRLVLLEAEVDAAPAAEVDALPSVEIDALPSAGLDALPAAAAVAGGGAHAGVWVPVAFAVGLSKGGRAALGEYAESDAAALAAALGVPVAPEAGALGASLPGELFAALVSAAVSLALSLDPAAGALLGAGGCADVAAPLAAVPRDAAGEPAVECAEASDDGWMYRALPGLGAAAAAALGRGAAARAPPACGAGDAVTDTVSLIEAAAETGRHVVWDVDGF